MVTRYKSINQDEIRIEMKAEMSKRVMEADVDNFTVVTGDKNPAHTNEHYAAETIYLSQDVKFKAPIYFNDIIIAKVEFIEIIDKAKFIIAILKTIVINQEEVVLIEGQATVIPPKL